MDAITASRYVEALQRIGVAVRLEPETLDIDTDIEANTSVGYDGSHSRTTSPAMVVRNEALPGVLPPSPAIYANHGRTRTERIASLPNVALVVLFLAANVVIKPPAGASAAYRFGEAL